MSFARSVKVRITADNSSAIKGAEETGAAYEKAASRAERAGARSLVSNEKVARAGRNVFIAGAAGLAVMEKANIEFDRGMSKAGAASLDTSKSAQQSARELGKLREAAIKAGADTAFSATDAAGGITELAKAGVKTSDILSGGLRGSLDLAAAGNISVADSAEYVATALTQFQLKGNKATHVADLLAAGAGKAQGEVSDMALALSYAGVPAAQLGISIEETAGTIALFAKNGLIGEKAGTSMRGMLASLTSPSKKASGLMSELGINVYDAQGRFVGFDGVAGQLQDRLGGLTEKQRNYALGQIFGNEQLQAANILMREGADGVKKMTGEVNDQGYAGEQAARMMDNLAGDIEKVKGSLETAFIKGGTGFQDGLRDMAQGVDGAIDRFNDLPDAVQENSVKAVAALTATGGIVWALAKVKGGIDTLRGSGRGVGARGVKASDAMSSGRVVPVAVTNWPPSLGGKAGPGSAGGAGSDTVVGGGAGGGKEKPRRTRRQRVAAGAQNFGTAALGILGGVTGVSIAVEAVGGKGVQRELDDVTESLKRTRAAGKDVSGGFMDIRSSLEQSNVGKYAKDLGIDLNRLAADIAINGDQGKYLDRTMKDLSDGGLKDAAAGLADFLTPGWDSRVKLAGRAVDDLGRISESAGQKQRDAAAGGDVFAAQIALNTATSRAYARVLRGMPEKVVTSVEAKGTELSRADVRGLQKQYDLTPRQVRTLMGLVGDGPTRQRLNAVQEQLARTGATKALPFVGQRGAEQTTGDLKRVQADLAALGRSRAFPRVQQQGAGDALSQMSRVRSGLAALNGYTANTYIRTTRLTGGVVGGPRPAAGGGTVPHTGLGYADRHLYLLADDEEVISDRVGQATRYRRVLKGINRNLPPEQIKAMLADGGTAGRAIRGLADGGSARRGSTRPPTRSSSRPRGKKGKGGNTPRQRKIAAFEKAIDKATDALDRETQQRDDLISKRDDMREAVSSSMLRDALAKPAMGNIWSATAEGQGTFTGAGSTALLRADTANIKQFKLTLQALQGMGLDGAAFEAVARSASEGDFAQANAIAALGKGGVQAWEQAFNDRAREAEALGVFAGDVVYGKPIAGEDKDVAEIKAELKDLNAALKAARKSSKKEKDDQADRIGARVGEQINGAASNGRRNRRARGGD